MENYISKGRRAYLNMLETIKPNADFVVDGTLQVTESAKIVFDNLKKLPLKHIQGKNL
jgi:uridine kinase